MGRGFKPISSIVAPIQKDHTLIEICNDLPTTLICQIFIQEDIMSVFGFSSFFCLKMFFFKKNHLKFYICLDVFFNVLKTLKLKL